MDLYRRTSEWIRGYTAEDRVVATLEIGGLGFYSNRPIHDLLALVSPAALPAVHRGDLAAAFHAGKPDLFVVYSPHRSLLQPILDDPDFQVDFCPVTRLAAKKGTPSVTVYGRRPRPATTPCVNLRD